MGRTTILAVAILVTALAGDLRAQEQSRAEQLVFLGIRPTGESGGGTDIRRLSEAQRFRSLAENVLEIVSGHPLVGHEELRKLLGNAYLVDLFDCGNRLQCVRGLLKPLRTAGYRTAVTGEYQVVGDVYKFRLVSFGIDKGDIKRETKFDLKESELEDPKKWRPNLEALLSNRGRLRIVSNVTGYTCTIDGSPCVYEADGETLGLTEGEHALELSKPGYRASSRVVTVKAGSAQQIAVALNRLPIQARAAPDRLIDVPEARTGVTIFGKAEMGVEMDMRNAGDNTDRVSPVNVPHEFHTSFMPRALLGASAASDQRGTWKTRGLVVIGLFPTRAFRLLIASAEISHEAQGFKLTVGQMFVPIVNNLAPGTFLETNQYGSIPYLFDGVVASKSTGPLVTEVGVGRPELRGIGEGRPPNGSANPLPVVEGRVAFVARSITGKLYNKDTPLTVSLSGSYGKVRLGPGEDTTLLDPMAAPAVVEDRQMFVAGGEALIPYWRFVFAGEAFVSKAAIPYGAAMVQGARIDLDNGLHKGLISLGMWGQLSFRPTDGTEVMALVGEERILDGLDYGVSVKPGALDIRSNRWIAAIATWYLTSKLRIGLQTHFIRTRYDAPDIGVASHVGGIVDVEINF